jgi:hypothetical protein
MKRTSQKTCSVKECTNPSRAIGLCVYHYNVNYMKDPARQEWRRERSRQRYKNDPTIRAKQRVYRKAYGLSPKSRARNVQYQRERYRNDPGHRTRIREYGFLKRHGINLKEKADRIRAQKERCAACNTTNPGKWGWQTDHNHTTKTLRGELCRRCNTALGDVNDRIEHLQQLIKYLEFWNRIDMQDKRT